MFSFGVPQGLQVTVAKFSVDKQDLRRRFPVVDETANFFGLPECG
jgi:hypothetical protein